MTGDAKAFATRLRGQREARLVTLDTIAERTKIRRTLLEDLERGEISSWPGGVFRRSYFRAYAEAVGLDPESAVREFVACFPETPLQPISALAAVAAAADHGDIGTHRPRLRIHDLIESAIGALPSFNGAAKSAPAPASDSSTTSDNAATLPEPAPTAAPVLSEATAAQQLAVAEPASLAALPALDHLEAVAELSTRLAQATSAADVEALFGDAARLLHAPALVLWLWNPDDERLWPSLSHGYTARVLARLPPVGHDATNAIAAAFRSASPQVVDGTDVAAGAIVVPLMTSTGCSGVLAFECRDRHEREQSTVALARIVAAQLSLLTDVRPGHAAIL